MEFFKNGILESIELKSKLLNDDFLNILDKVSDELTSSLLKGKKIMFCGNGGSAADAQHLAAELLVRLKTENNRKALPALSLALDSSTITACCNDYNFDSLYVKMIQALAHSDDVLIGISTSGNSNNVCLALKEAQERNIKTIGFLGQDGGKAIQYCDFPILVPSKITARIQECHILIGHLLIEKTENKLYNLNYIS